MKHTIEINDRQLEIILDLLTERLEDLEEDIAHYEANPKELEAHNEGDEEPLAISDYEHYRDEVQSLITTLPDLSAD
jgi:hypothetical protein